jgi:hypothetical protein
LLHAATWSEANACPNANVAQVLAARIMHGVFSDGKNSFHFLKGNSQLSGSAASQSLAKTSHFLLAVIEALSAHRR